jgi:hypothetical protein
MALVRNRKGPSLPRNRKNQPSAIWLRKDVLIWPDSRIRPENIIKSILAVVAGSIRSRGASLPSARLIRFAKLLVLSSNFLTFFCIALTASWHAILFAQDERWTAVPLSLLIQPAHRSNEIYATASISKVGQSGAAHFSDALLQLPIIAVLLFAAAFLTAFYLWLAKTERQLTARNSR